MQLIGMQEQQHLTPFILGPLGKAAKHLFNVKGEKAVRLSEIAKEKGLPLPLMTAIEGKALNEMVLEKVN